MAQLHAPPLGRAEALVWLGRTEGVGSDGATLAELYALRGDLDQVEDSKVNLPVGLYL